MIKAGFNPEAHHAVFEKPEEEWLKSFGVQLSRGLTLEALTLVAPSISEEMLIDIPLIIIIMADSEARARHTLKSKR